MAKKRFNLVRRMAPLLFLAYVQTQGASGLYCEDNYAREASANYDTDYPATQTRISKKIGKLELTGTSEELSTLAQMLGKQPPKDWDIKASGCKTVLCVLSKQFESMEAAQRSLSLKKRTGYYISIDQSKNAPNVEYVWPASEIRVLDRSFSRLPKSFYFLPSLEKITRSPIGYDHANDPFSVAYAIPKIQVDNYVLPGVINFYDLSLNSSNIKFRLETAIHELVHHLDFTDEIKNGIRISHRDDFLKLSGWQKSSTAKKGWAPGLKHQFVTTYSKTMPEEDLAEAASYYVMNSEYLKKTDSAKYAFLKENLFNSLEYPNEDNKLKSLSDETVLQNCLGKISSIELSKKNELRIGTLDKNYFYFFSHFGQLDSSYGLRQLDCIPEPNAEGGGLNVCDIGGTAGLKYAAYSGVLKSLDATLDQISNSWFNNDELKTLCYNTNDFTARCRLKKMTLPAGVNFEEVFSKIVTFLDSFSSRDLISEQAARLPLATIEMSCLNDQVERIGIQNGQLIVVNKGADKNIWYWYFAGRPICGTDTVTLLESNGVKLDKPTEILTAMAATEIAIGYQKEIMNIVLKSSGDCRRFFNRLDKSCMAKSLQTYFETLPAYNKLNEKLIQEFSQKIDFY